MVLTGTVRQKKYRDQNWSTDVRKKANAEITYSQLQSRRGEISGRN